MRVAHRAVARGQHTQDLATKALDKEVQIVARIRSKDVRKHYREARRNVHLVSSKWPESRPQWNHFESSGDCKKCTLAGQGYVIEVRALERKVLNGRKA